MKAVKVIFQNDIPVKAMLFIKVKMYETIYEQLQ